MVVAAIVEQSGRLLVTERLVGTHLAGYWEFPGGKVESGEDHRLCLKREMREELGVAIKIGNKLLTTNFNYPDRVVEIHFYSCSIDGAPKPTLGQRIQWVSRAELGTLRFPPADLDLIKLLTNH